MAHSALCQVKPTPNRGLGALDTERLRLHRSRYVAYQRRLDRDQQVWPPPDCARAYVAAVLAEIDGSLAGREQVAA
jgi:hypothetical protein